MELILSIAYTAFFIFLIGKLKFFRFDGISTFTIKAGFIIKIIAGIAVGLIYTYYYTNRLTADTFKFFDDSKILFDSVYTKPFDFFRMVTGIGAGASELQPYYDKMTNWYDTFSPYNDNRTMIRFNALVRFLSMGHYYVHVIFVCFLSLTGMVAIVKVFKREFPDLVLQFFFTFILLPSVLFWGSGLLKDALVFFAIGFVLYSFDKLINEKNRLLQNLILLVCFLFLLMISKFHVFILLLPLLTAWWLSSKTKLSPLISFMVCHLFFILIIFLLPLINDSYNLAVMLSHKQAAFYGLASSAGAGSIISIPILEPTILSILKNAPQAFITCFTRPFLTDGGSFLIKISALENILILVMGIIALIKIKIVTLKDKILPMLCLFYAATFFTLIGLVTPVMGAIVRYKAQALPFLVILFLIVLNVQLKGKLIENLVSPKK